MRPASRGVLVSEPEHAEKKRPRSVEGHPALYGAGSLAASFRRKMHIGYFYGDGRKGVRERLAVFRSISLEKSTRIVFLQAMQKNSPVIDHNTLVEKSGRKSNTVFLIT